jgi:hypothetical protein
VTSKCGACIERGFHIELVFKRIKQLLKQQRFRCTTAQAPLAVLLVGWALLKEESSTVRLAMADAMSCTHLAQEEQRGEQETTTTSWWHSCHQANTGNWLLRRRKPRAANKNEMI